VFIKFHVRFIFLFLLINLPFNTWANETDVIIKKMGMCAGIFIEEIEKTRGDEEWREAAKDIDNKIKELERKCNRKDEMPCLTEAMMHLIMKLGAASAKISLKIFCMPRWKNNDCDKYFNTVCLSSDFDLGLDPVYDKPASEVFSSWVRASILYSSKVTSNLIKNYGRTYKKHLEKMGDLFFQDGQTLLKLARLEIRYKQELFKKMMNTQFVKENNLSKALNVYINEHEKLLSVLE